MAGEGITIGAMDAAGHQVRRATRGRTLDRLARFGLVCRGVLYVLIGGLALTIAFGGQDEQADESGAISTLADQPFGMLALWLMLVGFAALAIWQLTEAVWGSDGAKDRVEAASRTVFYGLLVVSLANLLFAGEQVESGNERARDLTAKVLEWPAGQLLVGLAGLGVVGLGAYWVHKGITKRFEKDLHTERMSPRARSTVGTLGRIGYPARGVVAGFAGVFLVLAAIRYDPDDAKGFDAALRSLADTPVGPWLLVVVALGLLTFAAYCFCEARWRRV